MLGHARRQYLTLSEEMSLIQWMTNKQRAHDCVSPVEVRSKGYEIYFARTQTELHLIRGKDSKLDMH
jgi:hypothetical protein